VEDIEETEWRRARTRHSGGVNALGQVIDPAKIKQRRLESTASDGSAFFQPMNSVVTCEVMMKPVMPSGCSARDRTSPAQADQYSAEKSELNLSC